MWRVVKNHARVKWCLEHGASVYPRDFHPHKEGGITADQYYCEPILEVAVCRASVATFELLRSHGAQLGWRTLHRAVEFACRGTPPYYGRMTPTDTQVSFEPWSSSPWREKHEKLHESQYKEQDEKQDEKPYVRDHKERMAMLRHLIDVVRLDVNADDTPPGAPHIEMRWGPPTEYILYSTDVTKDSRDVTWLLLDRGADLTPVYRAIERCGDDPDDESPERQVFEDVESWKKARKPKKECCMH